jgi:alkaline phosphatase D
MTEISRRAFLETAVAFGASAAWGTAVAAPSRLAWRERRDLYPEGAASGDPTSDSVLLWTRRAPAGGHRVATLTVEVAEDASFRRVVPTTPAPISAAADWTCRVLVGGLKPSRAHW